MKCFVCEAELNGSKTLLRHFRLVHGFVPGKTLRLKCVEAGCGSVFGTFSGFRKHLHVNTLSKVIRVLKQLTTVRLPMQLNKVMLKHLIRLAVLER